MTRDWAVGETLEQFWQALWKNVERNQELRDGSAKFCATNSPKSSTTGTVMRRPGLLHSLPIKHDVSWGNLWGWKVSVRGRLLPLFWERYVRRFIRLPFMRGTDATARADQLCASIWWATLSPQRGEGGRQAEWVNLYHLLHSTTILTAIAWTPGQIRETVPLIATPRAYLRSFSSVHIFRPHLLRFFHLVHFSNIRRGSEKEVTDADEAIWGAISSKSASLVVYSTMAESMFVALDRAGDK